jgi:lipoprotein-anchoring transpeptidase ErfK/SrfK
MKHWLLVLITTFATATVAAQENKSTDSNDEKKLTADERTSDALQMQVYLDRLLFSPGAIDGMAGKNAEEALKAFQQANQMEPTGKLDDKTSEALATTAALDAPTTAYEITSDDIDTGFIKELPDEMSELAKLDALSYTNIQEMLAERFHTTPETLEHLNPDASWEAGESITVPNVQPTWIRPDKDTLELKDDKGEKNRFGMLKDLEQAEPGDIVSSSGLMKSQLPEEEITVIVTKSNSILQVRDKDGKIIFHAPVTSGSEHDPLPLGDWKVNGTEKYPKFNYNPELFWDAEESDEKAKIPHGANNPVGVAWIDLSKEHYGLHGTPEPSKIGYTASHGCVRLTNWDVLRLADMVKPETPVKFLENAPEGDELKAQDQEDDKEEDKKDED